MELHPDLWPHTASRSGMCDVFVSFAEKNKKKMFIFSIVYRLLLPWRSGIPPEITHALFFPISCGMPHSLHLCLRTVLQLHRKTVHTFFVISVPGDFSRCIQMDWWLPAHGQGLLHSRNPVCLAVSDRPRMLVSFEVITRRWSFSTNPMKH